ncbi:hypothetical protein NQ317_018779 [Molorchus minor]|uniref:Trichohyalin-plectin-homology domain-containing protein n=1 Tax=Molorchus minor TaxID=1323400 RepID=A0ABQ9J103_9CUCU|nr:hypothetical protein NQ317_018779 [Molorchus minor]
MDDVIAIYQNAKHQIDCMRIEKEAEKQEAMIKRREVVAKIVAAGETAKAETEEKMLLAKIKEREEYDAKMRQERLDDRNRFLERRKEEERKEAEMQKWEMVNRYKIGEFTKQYELDKKKELWQSILRRRKELMEQMEEDERRRMEEKRIDDCLSKVSFEEDDEKFFDYADEVLQLTKKKGRPTYPIEKIILAYKKFNSLMPPLKKVHNLRRLQSRGK